MMENSEVIGIELAEFFKNRFKEAVAKVGRKDNIQALEKLSDLIEKIKSSSSLKGEFKGDSE